MSDPQKPTVELDSMALLEKKLNREKQARLQAEKQLEQYSLDIYNANKKLKASLLKAEKNQQDLKFLNKLASLVSSDTDSNKLFDASIKLIGDYIDASGACCMEYVIKEGVTSVSFKQVDKLHIDLVYILKQDALNLFPSHSSESELKWHSQKIETQIETDNALWLLGAPIWVSKSRLTWLIFGISSLPLDEQNVVLDTAKSQLQTGIRRRQNEERVIRRNKALQDTIENLEETRQQLIKAEKMASLGQLAAGIAHEINNPIGYINANLQILQEYADDFKQFDSKVQQLANQASLDLSTVSKLREQYDIDYLLTDSNTLVKANLDGTKRVADIVDGLRTFSHSSSAPVFEPVSLFDVVDSALQIIWNSLKYDYKVDNQLDKSLPHIQGNHGQLQQVFINLFMNAVHAMPKGGDLTIASKQLNNAISISVADTGHGMDKNTLGNLFTPFFTTKPVGKGTGLGLSVSFAIIEAHGANIEVSSTVGEGSCFTLHFPVPHRP